MHRTVGIRSIWNQYLSHVSDRKAMEWLGEPGNQGYMKDLRLLDYLFSMLQTQSMVVGFLCPHPEAEAALQDSGARNYEANGTHVPRHGSSSAQ